MSDLKPKVLVIGVSGALGRAVCDVFSARHWNVLRGLRTPDGQPDSVYVDLEDEQSVAEAMAGVDIVVNTVPLNYTAERIALTTGAKLLSLAITEMSAQQGLRNQYLRASGTVVLNAGLAPGVTNLVVNDLVSHDRYWKGRITIAVPLPWNGYRGAEGIRLVHANFTTSGRHGAYSGSHDAVVISFPEPIGDTECIGWSERNDGWVQRLAAGRMVRAYCYIDNRRLNSWIVRLNKRDILGRLPLWPFLRFQRRFDAPTEEPVSIWVSLKTPEFEHSRIITCTGWYLSSAKAAEVMAAQLLNSEHLAGRGCLDSNEAFTLAELAGPLQECGVVVHNHLPEIGIHRAVPAYAGRPAAGWAPGLGERDRWSGTDTPR